MRAPLHPDSLPAGSPPGAPPTGGPPTGADAPALPAGGFVTLDGEDHYRIAGYDRMAPFLVTLPSDGDLWMFVTSGGGLTAGRVDADGALFPYETVDRLHDAHHHTGPITLFRVQGRDGTETAWEPFAPAAPAAGIERNLYKNVTGNRLVWEEIHHGLGLAFRAGWSACGEFGHVRTASLANLGPAAVSVALLDGLRNLLPFGVPLALEQQSSCLVDAYKRSECDPATGLGLFTLTARIVDRAEACEVLRANVAWCHGLPRRAVALGLGAVGAFRRGAPVQGQDLLTGERGNYLVHAVLALPPGARARWHVGADVGRTQAQVVALGARLRDPDFGAQVDAALERAGANLRRLVAEADGVQRTARPVATAHHFANVLMNAMRGGVFEHGGAIPVEDWVDFLRTRQRRVAERHAALLAGLPATLPVGALLDLAERTGDADLERLALEYLPLGFARRHGDPSRPWNRFTIRVTNPDGGRALQYEGNWRDIFQNWEALAVSYPAFLPGMVAKFVNASTVDGFNPYRIARDGIDWEVEEPGRPWSNLGYWGDHQVVYLLRLLEWLERFSPGTLGSLLGRAVFSYADVPYRIAPYEELLAEPRVTIRYDHAAAARTAERVHALGTDGRLVARADGTVVHVSLLEKLLVTLLAKLSNLVPEGGIWMNTQRPEWNDANNALVGPGVSVVTLAHLRRFVVFLAGLLDGLAVPPIAVSADVVRWARRMRAVLTAGTPALAADPIDERARKELLDGVGRAFSDYRAAVYAHGPAAGEPLPVPEALELCRVALLHIEHALRANRRPDGLYHAYNLMRVTGDGRGITLRRLPEMLEGQVAALSSGAVGPAEAVHLLDRLFDGPLYRADQRSFLLYPERRLPGFLERNVVPKERVRAIPLLARLVDRGETSLIERDPAGTYRFQADLANAADVARSLDRLARDPAWAALVPEARGAVLDLYEAVFDHGSFTGRSGAMYAYEGLGSVYWHMVSKLLLAVQEIALRAHAEPCPAAVREALVAHYFRIRAGLGCEKSPAEFGAFPMDPYSHTPRGAGARQPGMTGSVKEEILARLGELGVEIDGGRVAFRPRLLRADEFLPAPATFRSHDVAGRAYAIALPEGSLAFTLCQVPVVYTRTAGEASLRVTAAGGETEALPTDLLDPGTSRALFERRGGVARIDVGVPESALRGG